MLQRIVGRCLVVVAAAALAFAASNCAPSDAGRARIQVPPERIGSAAPPLPQPLQPARSAAVFRFAARETDWTLPELFDEIHRTTGISILYDASDARFGQMKFACVLGVHTIRVDELFDWLQAVLSYLELVVVPVGPTGVEGKQEWLVTVRRAPPDRPPYIEATDIAKYANRRDLYIMTTIALSPTCDATQMRTALSPLLTAEGGAGRIAEIPGEHALVVVDFAPVVAEVVRRAALLEKEFAEKAASPGTDPR